MLTTEVPTSRKSGRQSVVARATLMIIFLLTVAVVTVPTAGAATAAPSVSLTTLTNSWLVAAKGTPAPSSGQEVFMPYINSAVEGKISGSGSVVIDIRGSSCKGVWPEIKVTIDNAAAGTKTVTSVGAYGAYSFGSGLSDGTHAVRIVVTTGAYSAGSCDTNAWLGGVEMKASAPPATTSTTTTAPTTATTTTTNVAIGNSQPGSANTGVPAGTRLTIQNGDLTVTKAGTVIDALDIRGSLYIKADNVTVKRSIIRGGPALTRSGAIVAAWWGFRNFRIEDSTIVATNPSLHIDGLSGSNITAVRMNIYGVVDAVKVIGSNFTITDSWIHNLIHSDSDPNQKDGKTHDDGVQVEGGNNIVIQRNTVTGVHNAAVQVTQNYAVTSNIKIADNWLSGGGCTVNVTQMAKGGPIKGMTISSNKFGPGLWGLACAIRIPTASPISVASNVWASNSKPVPLQWF